MKKANSIIIATVIATFVISIFAIQPTTTEASSKISPTATPSPRTKRPKTIQSPKPIQSSITKSKTKAKKTGFQEVSGIGMEVTRKKQPRKRNTQKRQHLPCKAGDCK